MSSPATPIQCSTGPFWAFELERAMDLIAEAGFTQIELMVTRDPRTQSPDLPVRLAAERSIEIAAVHGPFLVISKSVWGLDPINKITRGIEFCKAVGATCYIVHPPFLWERTYANWVVNESAGVCEQEGIRVAVETMYPKWLAGRRMRAYRWLEPQALVDAAPYLVLDTSHLTVGRQDILDAYNTMRAKLVHIHLSNNAGDGRDGHLELERGILAIDRFLEEVRRTSYEGAISLEVSVNRYLERPKELVQMLRRNRQYVQDKLTRGTRGTKGLPRE